MEDEKPKLPGNHGQFGTNNATEDYKRMDDAPPEPQPEQPLAPSPGLSDDAGPRQTNAGDRS